MEKKYEITDEKIAHVYKQTGTIRTLYKIKALIDIENTPIKAGDLGGFIESENNLSQEDRCWIGNGTKVYENAVVKNDAIINGNIEIRGNASVCDYAYINAGAYAKIQIYDNAKIGGSVKIEPCGDDIIKICGNSVITGMATIYNGPITISGNAIISSNAKIRSFNGPIYIGDYCVISTDAHIDNKEDFFFVSGIGDDTKGVTFYNTFCNKIKIQVSPDKSLNLRDALKHAKRCWNKHHIATFKLAYSAAARYMRVNSRNRTI